MRVILLVEPDQAEREILIDECNSVGLVITIDDPSEACALLQTLKFDIAVVGRERLDEPSFGVFFSSLRLTAPHTTLLSLPLPSCPP
jgi:hypothetical protein